MKNTLGKIVIMGATSGIGREVAEIMAAKGWQVGAAGRRGELLDELRAKFPDRVVTAVVDVLSSTADEAITALLARLGGADVYLHCSGIGYQNAPLAADKELSTLRTNCEGFARSVGAAFRYFAANGGGRIAAITSIAGTKGLGLAPAYSASKRFQSTYLDALEQLSHIRGCGVSVTDIRPGFVATALIDYGRNYPFVMPVGATARSVVRAVLRGRRVATIDARYAALVALWRLIPRCLWARFPFKVKDA